MARKGILTNSPASPAPRRTVDTAPRGAVGALQSSLSKLQESAVQDVDAALIDDAGMEDRLGFDSAAQAQLRDSLKTYGQQVPVLLRPHPDKPGRFEIVYGRRRLSALRDLGLPVKAMIRQLDDQALVMAQGQENTSRQDLSFIEKASFAAQLLDANYDRETIAAALSIDLPMVSRLLKVGTAFSLPFLRQIGSAPSIGRDRWMALTRLMEDKSVASQVTAFMRTPDFSGDSDARFEQVFHRASSKPAKPGKSPAPKPLPLRARDGTVLGHVKNSAKGLTVTIPSRSAPGFDQWLSDQLETALQDLYDGWQSHRPSDET